MKLAEQLRAFHRVVVGAAPPAEAAELVRGDGVDPEIRLRVYAHAYVSRIGGVLRDHYPKLHALLGQEAFARLVRDYLRAYPPHDPSLREAGAELARFLFDTTKDYLHVDLARLERARVEALDGPDAATLTREAVAALPPEAFPGLRLVLVPTAQRLLLTTNADDVWDAPEGARARVDIRRSVLVWRRDLTVIHRTLEADEATALERVIGGATFAGACEALATNENPTRRAIELLLRWLDAGVLAG